jgi:hypothetical protein
MTTRILLAQEDMFTPVMAELDNYDLLKVTTLKSAQRLIIEDGINLVIIDMAFDHGAVMDLVSFIRENHEHSKIPIIITRSQPVNEAAFVRSLMNTLCSVGIVNEYLELDNPERAIVHIKTAVYKLVGKAA